MLTVQVNMEGTQKVVFVGTFMKKTSCILLHPMMLSLLCVLHMQCVRFESMAGAIHPDVKKEDLTNLFLPFGTVINVEIPIDNKTGMLVVVCLIDPLICCHFVYYFHVRHHIITSRREQGVCVCRDGDEGRR